MVSPPSGVFQIILGPGALSMIRRVKNPLPTGFGNHGERLPSVVLNHAVDALGELPLLFCGVPGPVIGLQAGLNVLSAVASIQGRLQSARQIRSA